MESPLSTKERNMVKRITVFTPTYNRAELLPNLYESLLRQSCRDFRWLVIDDGSTDSTEEVVAAWIREGKIDIQYVRKENGGLHTGYNKAIESMDTELSICIDSDDYLTDVCIETVLKFWDEHKAEDIAGIIGLDITEDGHVIAGNLPNEKVINPLMLLAAKENGDRKYVIRNDCYRQVYPMPVFEGEKNFNPHYLVLKMCRDYKFLVLNKPLCVVNYQPDGMSANIFKQYVNSPRSFAQIRKVIMENPNTSFLYLVKTTIHYVSSSILSKNKHFIRESPRKLLTVLMIPFGLLLTDYIKKKAAK